ncbi:MAG: hypothetical protein D6832_02335, partial [Alphaproteobacteria bacterium]
GRAGACPARSAHRAGEWQRGRLGAECRLAPSPGFSAARATLAELTGRRDQLKRVQVQEKNRLAKSFLASVRGDIEDSRDLLARCAERIEAEITRGRGHATARVGADAPACRAGGRMPGALRAPGRGRERR